MAFRSNNKEPQRPTRQGRNPEVPAGQINMIGQGTVIEGTVRAINDMRISGKVIGEVHVEGRFILSPEGVIEGHVHAQNADIAGQVQGNIQVQDRLSLKVGSQVHGNISAQQFTMEDGAVFNGQCDMGNLAPTAKKDKNAKGAAPLPVNYPPAETGSTIDAFYEEYGKNKPAPKGKSKKAPANA